MYEHVGQFQLPEEWPMPPIKMDWLPSGYGYGKADDEQQQVCQELLDVFLPGDWCAVMLVVIKPQGFIRLHRDEPLFDGIERHHLVQQTNHHCWNLHGGVMQQLGPGGIYRMEPTSEHASINWGDTERIHLVIDLVPAPVGSPSGGRYVEV